MAAVLFDLDGVFTRRDSMGALVTARLIKRPWRLPVAVGVLLWAGAGGSERPRRQRANRALVSLALRGETSRSYRRLVWQTADRFAASRSLIRSEAVTEARNRLVGDRVVVVTASEEVLARAILERLGLEGLEVLASSVTFTAKGGFLREHNVGETKVRRVRDAGIKLSDATFFTDSVADLPLAAVVDRVVVVGPLSGAGRALLRRLPAAAQVTW